MDANQRRTEYYSRKIGPKHTSCFATQGSQAMFVAICFKRDLLAELETSSTLY